VTPPERCSCGRAWQRGLRYGPTPEPVPVLVCWEGCGAEWPPLLTSTVDTCARGHAWITHGRVARDGWRYCLACKAWTRAVRRTA
jgi:hypothetical protein